MLHVGIMIALHQKFQCRNGDDNMNRKAVEWLYEQLPELVEKGIIPIGSVDLIRNHYGQADKKLGGRTILTMFGIVGTVLVGLGIILILAHNWDQMSRMTRTLIAVGMLLGAQILVGVSIWFKKDHAAWTESTSTFLMVTIGASIALIGQTYHISDNFSTALLIWMLLSLPLVYLMGVTTPVVLYLIGVTTWAVDGEFLGIGKQLIWILLALVGPYYWRLVKVDAYGNQPVILSWVLTICFYISFGMAFETYLQYLSMLSYAALFAITYFAGIIWFDAPVKVWQRPLTLIGFTGCVGLSFLLTFKDVWSSLGQEFSSIGGTEYFLAFSLLAFVMVIGQRAVSKTTNQYLLFGGVPLVVGAGFMLLYFDASGINAAVLCNAYLLLLSVHLILRGVRAGSLGVLNIGMLMVASLIIMRFFDLNFSFVARGLAFVILGSCFLVTNWIMVRRKKEVQNEK